MKKTKLKFAAAVAALAMTFAFVTSCGNASDVVDEIVNGGGDDSGSTDTGAKDEAEEEEKAGTDESTEETTVKTKYTNSAWVKTVSAQYDNITISFSDMELDSNLKLEDYAYVKVNATFTKGDATVGYFTESWGKSPVAQGIIFEQGDWSPIATISCPTDISDTAGSISTFLPLTTGKTSVKFCIQDLKGPDCIDKISINYVEFVKIADVKYTAIALTGDEVTANKDKGSKVVFGVVYDSSATANNGIGDFASSDWSSNAGLNICSGNEVSAGSSEEFEFDSATIATKIASYPQFNFYNGAHLAYIYFK